jgi:DtxR family Mn-dependent transcriptional regulator
MSPEYKVSPTLQDYLETILHLVKREGAARTCDIADSMSVHKSTVTAALRNLLSKHLINYAPYGLVTLTPRGRQVAEEVSRRHEGIYSFLTDVLGVSEDLADSDACRLEHAIDREVFHRLTQLAEFIKTRPAIRDEWAETLNIRSEQRERA